MDQKELKKVFKEAEKTGIHFVVNTVDGLMELTPVKAAVWMSLDNDVERNAAVLGVSARKVRKFMEWKESVSSCAAVTSKGVPCKNKFKDPCQAWTLKEWEQNPDKKVFCRIHEK